MGLYWELEILPTRGSWFYFCDYDLWVAHDSLNTVMQDFVVFFLEQNRLMKMKNTIMYVYSTQKTRQIVPGGVQTPGYQSIGECLSHLRPLTLQKPASATGQTEDLTFSFSFFLSLSRFRNSTTRSRDVRIYSKNVQYLQCKVGRVPTPSPSPPRSIFIWI